MQIDVHVCMYLKAIIISYKTLDLILSHNKSTRGAHTSAKAQHCQ